MTLNGVIAFFALFHRIA